MKTTSYPWARRGWIKRRRFETSDNDDDDGDDVTSESEEDRWIEGDEMRREIKLQQQQRSRRRILKVRVSAILRWIKKKIKKLYKLFFLKKKFNNAGDFFTAIKVVYFVMMVVDFSCAKVASQVFLLSEVGKKF